VINRTKVAYWPRNGRLLLLLGINRSTRRNLGSGVSKTRRQRSRIWISTRAAANEGVALTVRERIVLGTVLLAIRDRLELIAEPAAGCVYGVCQFRTGL